MKKEPHGFLYKFYDFIESFGMWIAERGESIQSWALRKMGHESLARIYAPLVPEKTLIQISSLLDEAEDFEGKDDALAISRYQDVLKLIDPLVIQKYDDGELFLDDEIEGEIGIEYEGIMQSLYDLFIGTKKYTEAAELCEKMIGIDLGFSGSKEQWKHNLMDAKRHSEPKIGRNEPCPCGSGKKYKKCCGA